MPGTRLRAVCVIVFGVTFCLAQGQTKSQSGSVSSTIPHNEPQTSFNNRRRRFNEPQTSFDSRERRSNEPRTSYSHSVNSLTDSAPSNIVNDHNFGTTQCKVSDLDKKIDPIESKLSDMDSKLNDKLSDIYSKLLGLSDIVSSLEPLGKALGKLEDNCDDIPGSVFRPLFSTRQTVTWPDGTKVLCDTQTSGGGWTIFQRRYDGSVDFYRNWDAYENGFGDPEGEFWLGLKPLHQLLETGDFELRIDMKYEGKEYFAVYSQFKLSPASDNYTLTISGYSGTAGNQMGFDNGMQFSTKDRDNDHSMGGNCAKGHHGAWWYYSCTGANLNGLWGSTFFMEGLAWYDITGVNDSVTFSEMKVRKKN